MLGWLRRGPGGFWLAWFADEQEPAARRPVTVTGVVIGRGPLAFGAPKQIQALAPDLEFDPAEFKVPGEMPAVGSRP